VGRQDTLPHHDKTDGALPSMSLEARLRGAERAALFISLDNRTSHALYPRIGDRTACYEPSLAHPVVGQVPWDFCRRAKTL
jgi:hypothetical protein